MSLYMWKRDRSYVEMAAVTAFGGTDYWSVRQQITDDMAEVIYQSDMSDKGAIYDDN